MYLFFYLFLAENESIFTDNSVNISLVSKTLRPAPLSLHPVSWWIKGLEACQAKLPCRSSNVFQGWVGQEGAGAAQGGLERLVGMGQRQKILLGRHLGTPQALCLASWPGLSPLVVTKPRVNLSRFQDFGKMPQGRKRGLLDRIFSFLLTLWKNPQPRANVKGIQLVLPWI